MAAIVAISNIASDIWEAFRQFLDPPGVDRPRVVRRRAVVHSFHHQGWSSPAKKVFPAKGALKTPKNSLIFGGRSRRLGIHR
jgi:hypothetical protein